MTKRRRIAALALACAFFALAPIAHAGMEVNINFALGGKALDEDDWGESDAQGLFGIKTTFGQPDWPVAVALDYVASADVDQRLVVAGPVVSEVDLVQVTTEFDGGVRKIWKSGKARPFVGGGFGVLAARQERVVPGTLLTIDDSDSTLGVWVNGGCFWRLGKRFNIGIDLRLSAGEVEVFGRDVQAGGSSLALLLGWGWGGR